MCSTNTGDGSSIQAEGDTFPYEERAAHYEGLVARTLERLSLSERPSVCFHYSARFSGEDRDAILRGARQCTAGWDLLLRLDQQSSPCPFL